MEPVGSVVDKLKGFAKSSQDFINSLINHHHNSARRKPGCKMVPVGSVVDKLKGFAKSSQDFINSLIHRHHNSARRKPILSFHKSSKRSPFQEASTHVWGEDVLGALLMVDTVDQQNCDALGRAGIRTGIHSKLTFETTIRQKHTLVAKFVASEKGKGCLGDVSGIPLAFGIPLALSKVLYVASDIPLAFGIPLALSKVLYVASVNDWLSAVAIPVGAECRDVGIATNSSHQGKGLADFSSLGPPLLTQHNGSAASAIGLTVRKSNVVASLALLVSGLGMHPNSVRIRHCFSTFGQVVCQLSRGTKLSLLGLHQVSKSSSQHVSLGPLTIPVGISRHRNAPETSLEASAPPMGTNTEENVSAGSIALVLESELDESARIRGWVEMKTSNPKYLQWGVTMSDSPENEFGWGLSLGGIIQGPTSWDHFQVEAFLKFNLGQRISLQPRLVYVMAGPSHIPALMFRFNWAL